MASHPTPDKPSDDAQHIELENYVFIREDLGPLTALSDVINATKAELEQIGDSFGSNLIGIWLSAASLWKLASEAGLNTAYESHVGVALGMDTALSKVIGGGDVDGEAIRKRVDKRLEDKTLLSKHQELGERVAKDYLANFIRNQLGYDAATHLLRQCTVLTWGAFEVLATDIFVLLLNKNLNLPPAYCRTTERRNCFSSETLPTRWQSTIMTFPTRWGGY